MMLTERIVYSETDIPAKNMRVWIDNVYPLFELFFMSNNEVDAIESELLNKILLKSDDESDHSHMLSNQMIKMEGTDSDTA